jgi:hypothetical protein
MKIILMLLMVMSFAVHATDKPKSVQKDGRVYQVNKYGQTQYGKTSLRIKGDRVYEVNKFGQTQYHKPSLKIKK